MARETRKEKALQLLQMLDEGPAGLDPGSSFRPLDREAYELWYRTWIRRQLIGLIPELRSIEFDLIYEERPRHGG